MGHELYWNKGLLIILFLELSEDDLLSQYSFSFTKKTKKNGHTLGCHNNVTLLQKFFKYVTLISVLIEVQQKQWVGKHWLKDSSIPLRTPYRVWKSLKRGRIVPEFKDHLDS